MHRTEDREMTFNETSMTCNKGNNRSKETPESRSLLKHHFYFNEVWNSSKNFCDTTGS